MTTSLKRLFGHRCASSLAFTATVALGYLSSFLEGAIHPTNPRWAWCLVYGAIYASLGTIEYTVFRIGVDVSGRVFYLFVQACLLFGIFWTSHLDGDLVICALPLVAATVALLEPAGATIGVVLIYGLMLFVEYAYYGFGAFARWAISWFPAYGFIVIFTRMAVREKAARYRAESLSAEVEKLAVIQERNRLAREIHDSLGHFLTTIHVQLEAARAIHSVDPRRALEAVAKAQDLARDALVEVRRSVGALQADRAPAPLATRLRDLTSATDGWGAAVSLEVLGEPRTLASETEHAFFRAAQEGLTNVRKHAQAQTARVELDYRDPAKVFVRVSDDGLGTAAGPAGHGLAGLRERIAFLDGRVIAENPPGGGFRLQVEIAS